MVDMGITYHERKLAKNEDRVGYIKIIESKDFNKQIFFIVLHS